MKYKFKIGDRVRITKGNTVGCNIGDVGTIDFCDKWGVDNVYLVKIDRLEQKRTTDPTCACVVESWLEYEKPLITCE